MRALFSLMTICVVACGTEAPPAGCPSGVLVVGTDYMSSVVGVLPLDGTPAQVLPSVVLGGDPALATSAGRHFFIERTGGTIFELDMCGRVPDAGTFPSKTSQEVVPMGDSSMDPQDVAVAQDGSLWIARLDFPSALIVDANAVPAGTIDFSSYDTDGNADTGSVRILGSRAFFTMLRLTGERSEQPSQMAVVDTTSHAVTNVVTLAGRNPSALMVEQNGLLYLADSGNFDDATETDAGIEVFDTNSLTSKLILNEPALGGSASEVAVSKCGAVIIADATAANNTSLVSFTLDGAHMGAPIATTANFNLRGLLWTDDHTLIMGDRTPLQSSYPVHVFTADPSTCALTEKAPLTMPTLPALAFAL